MGRVGSRVRWRQQRIWEYINRTRAYKIIGQMLRPAMRAAIFDATKRALVWVLQMGDWGIPISKTRYKRVAPPSVNTLKRTITVTWASCGSSPSTSRNSQSSWVVSISRQRIAQTTSSKYIGIPIISHIVRRSMGFRKTPHSHLTSWVPTLICTTTPRLAGWRANKHPIARTQTGRRTKLSRSHS